MFYVALDKLPEQCDDQNIYPTGTNADKQYILLNAPPIDSELQDADSFRKLAKPVDSLYCFKNHLTNRYEVVEKPASHRENMENWIINTDPISRAHHVVADQPINITTWEQGKVPVPGPRDPPPGLGNVTRGGFNNQDKNFTGSHIWGNPHPIKYNQPMPRPGNEMYRSYPSGAQYSGPYYQYPGNGQGYSSYGMAPHSGYDQGIPSSQWDNSQTGYYQYQNQYDSGSGSVFVSGSSSAFDNNDREVQRITNKEYRNSDSHFNKSSEIQNDAMSKSMGAIGIGSNSAFSKSKSEKINESFHSGFPYQDHNNNNVPLSNINQNSNHISPSLQPPVHNPNQPDNDILSSIFPTKDDASTSTGSQIRSPSNMFDNSNNNHSDIISGMGSLSVGDNSGFNNRNSPYRNKVKNSPISDLWGSSVNNGNIGGSSSKLQNNWNENNVGVIGTNSSNSILNDPALKSNNNGLLSSLSNNSTSNNLSTSGISTATTTSSGVGTMNSNLSTTKTNGVNNGDCVTKFVEYMKSKYNMKVIRSFPDGNELYRALADQIYNDQTRFSSLRNDVVEHMRKTKSTDELETLSDFLNRKIEIFEVDAAMQSPEQAQLPTPKTICAPSLLFNDTNSLKSSNKKVTQFFISFLNFLYGYKSTIANKSPRQRLLLFNQKQPIVTYKIL